MKRLSLEQGSSMSWEKYSNLRMTSDSQQRCGWWNTFVNWIDLIEMWLLFLLCTHTHTRIHYCFVGLSRRTCPSTLTTSSSNLSNWNWISNYFNSSGLIWSHWGDWASAPGGTDLGMHLVFWDVFASWKRK